MDGDVLQCIPYRRGFSCVPCDVFPYLPWVCRHLGMLQGDAMVCSKDEQCGVAYAGAQCVLDACQPIRDYDRL